MLLSARRNQIITLLKEKKHLYVRELANHFKVSDETIRRDLKNLEMQGFITKEHGGANISLSGDVEAPFREREVRNLERKKSIARTAVGLIRPGEVVVIDGSTSAFELVKLLSDIPLTVLTNSLVVMQALCQNPAIQVVSTGGMLDRKHMTFYGDMVDGELEKLNAGKLFFSCQGIDPDAGLSDANIDIIRVKRRMMAASREHILLADSEKFTVRALYRSFPITDMHVIITDDGLPDDCAEKITSAGIRLLYGK